MNKRKVSLQTMEWVAVLRGVGAEILFPTGDFFGERDEAYTHGVRVNKEGVIEKSNADLLSRVRKSMKATSFLVVGSDGTNRAILTTAMPHRNNLGKEAHLMMNCVAYSGTNMMFLFGDPGLEKTDSEFFESPRSTLGYRAWVCEVPKIGDSIFDIMHPAHFSCDPDSGGTYVVIKPMDGMHDILTVAGTSPESIENLIPVVSGENDPTVLSNAIKVIAKVKSEFSSEQSAARRSLNRANYRDGVLPGKRGTDPEFI